MAIKKGDPKLVASEVMDDVPEGGGGPTSRVIADGASNALFPDISESNRAAGAVHARKCHLWVQSADTDTFLGANIIVAEPPNDPRVSITLFSTGDVFDKRASAIGRMESYLARGAAYAGYLYGDMVQGQAVVTVLQRTGELPAIGSTLALVKRQGYSNEFTQFVRIIEARAVLQTFTDANGDFTRYVLSLKLSDPLRQDFQGFAASRIDPLPDDLLKRTSVNNVAVADAARYYGVTRTKVAAGINDFSVRGESIFSQLVPSAQIETVIADARTNQISAGMQATGDYLTRDFVGTLTPTQSLFIGGGVKPGTLTLESGAAVIEDSGGRLLAGGEQVGTIDYENGVLSLVSPVFGAGGVNFRLRYRPAQAVQAVSQSQGFKVTQASRATSYVGTIEPVPVDASLIISYRVNAQWYVLRDEGGGRLRGADTSTGAGSLNLTTGTFAVTLGALPDVGSDILVQWVESAGTVDASQLVLDNDGRLYWPVNVDGATDESAGSRAVVPGQFALVWDYQGSIQTVTDNGAGRLIGAATGTIDYAKGLARVSPDVLPPVGTPVTVNTDTTAVASFTDRPVVAGRGTLGIAPVRPGSVRMQLTPDVKLRYDGEQFIDGPTHACNVVDDGQGKLIIQTDEYGANGTQLQCGTVNYQTGEFELVQTIALPTAAPALLAFMRYNNFYLNSPAAPMLVGNTLR